MEEQDNKKESYHDIAIGLSIGVLLGVALENIPIGLAVGVALFGLLRLIRENKNKDNKES